MEALSHRLGWPTDPSPSFNESPRTTRREAGGDVQGIVGRWDNIGGPEFNTATRDLQGRFEARETGTYRLQIRDLFNTAESDPRFGYRLSIRKESPDFRMVALPQPPPPISRDKKEALPWVPFLRKGETIAVKVLAFRRDNFNGEIQLSVEGLPAGVHSHDAKIESGKSAGLILLTADEKAAGWVGLVRVLGKARIGGTDIVREAREGGATYSVPDYNNEPVQARIGGGMMLGVSEKETAPIWLASVEDKLCEISLAGKLQIPLKVARRGDFNDSVKLKAAGLPALDPAKEIDVNAKTNETLLTLDLTQLKIPVGTHSIYLETQSKGRYRRMTSEDVKTLEAMPSPLRRPRSKWRRKPRNLHRRRKDSAGAGAATKSRTRSESRVKAAIRSWIPPRRRAKTSTSEDLAAARGTRRRKRRKQPPSPGCRRSAGHRREGFH